MGEDILPIKNCDLENSTILYVGVKCKGECLYNITSYYENKFEIYAGLGYYLNDKNISTRIFHYNHTAKERGFEIYTLAGYNEDLDFKVQFISIFIF
jgi:hypothetical protein